ncbi:hypothetical protein ACIHFD_01935 [Nonomuraea sp. NPDC051941]
MSSPPVRGEIIRRSRQAAQPTPVLEPLGIATAGRVARQRPERRRVI